MIKVYELLKRVQIIYLQIIHVSKGLIQSNSSNSKKQGQASFHDKMGWRNPQNELEVKQV